jgi:hypothetical protein
MTDQSAVGFTILDTPVESAMPDGSNVLLSWPLSGTPDGQWERDFAGSSYGQGEVLLSLTGSTIVGIVPKDESDEVRLFVQRQLNHANQLLVGRKLELG